MCLCRARCRARQREADDLDALELRYSKLLTYCDPKLARAHREEERRESRRMARRQRISKQPIPVVQSDSKCRDSDDCPSDGSGAIEDSEDEMGHKYRMKEVNSDEHIDGHTHLVNESSYSVSAVPPKLLALKHPAKEEASSRFNVLKKPDEPYETAMPWIIAKNVTGREPKVSAKEEVITGDASFVSPKIAMSGTMGSTGMSIDSLQRIAADIEVLETVVAWRSASPAFCQLPQAGATSEPVVEVENISIPKIGNFSAINLDKNLDLLSTVSPLSTDLLAGSTDSLPITKNHPIAQSTLQITELGDESLDYYPFTPEDIVDCECVQIDRQIEAKKYLSGTMVDSVVRQQTEVIAEPHVLERSKTGTYGTDRWSKSDRFRAELDEHNYLFEHPHKSAEFTLGVIDNELAIGQRVILEQRSDVIDDIEDFEGETPGDIDRRPVATDMLSPLGVVGTAVLRKRAATGTAGGLSMASDEDDRVLMGTASLHRPYDSTGHLSAETNETSVTSTSNLDLSEDQELTLSVPIQQPPAPPSKQGPAVDACTPALSTLDTEDSSVGFDLTASENIQSFGEASSDVGLSQGFVANLTARYLNPDILGGAADATTRSTHYDDAAADEDVIDALRWCPGRASLDLIETAMAIDAYVSSVRIEPPFLQSGNIQKV